MRFVFESWLNALLIFVPVSAFMKLMYADPTWIFFVSALGIIPLAGMLGTATEQLTARVGAGLGGLLNASLGNAAELIIAPAALREGLHVRQGVPDRFHSWKHLTGPGSLDASGGLSHERQKFNRTAAGTGSSLLLLSAVGLVVPALFHFTASERGVTIECELSLAIAGVFFLIYLLSLAFSLKTHRHLYTGEHDDEKEQGQQPWKVKKALGS
jgi:Ca2+:H+ antiporter